MKKQGIQGSKVNDNLQYVPLSAPSAPIQRRYTRRPCGCPVCVTDDRPFPANTLLNATPNTSFLTDIPKGVSVLGLLKVPNATAHDAWVDAKLIDEGGRWREDIEDTASIMRKHRKKGRGHTHVYNEGGDVLTCWAPVLDTKPVPPVRSSGCSTRLSGKQKKAIRLASKLLGELRGPSVFLTLTFKNDEMCHTRAKRDLDTFLKRYKRHTGCSRFLWVAEIQPKRAARTGKEVIHFHVILKSRVDMEWLQDGWRQITGQETSQQDIRPIDNAGGLGKYVSKYVSKGCKGEIFAARYSMDRETRRGIKPQTLEVYPSTYAEWHDKMSQKGCQIGSNVVYLGNENFEYQ